MSSTCRACESGYDEPHSCGYSDNWLPIEGYNKKKNKPKYAIFWVQEHVGERWQNNLAETISTDLIMGSRTITHYMVIEPPQALTS